MSFSKSQSVDPNDYSLNHVPPTAMNTGIQLTCNFSNEIVGRKKANFFLSVLRLSATAVTEVSRLNQISMSNSIAAPARYLMGSPKQHIPHGLRARYGDYPSLTIPVFAHLEP